jgi:hypothetical protein
MRNLLALVLVLCGQEKAARTLEWKLSSGQVAEYVRTDPLGAGATSERFFILGSELTARRNRLAVDDYQTLARSLLFELPPQGSAGSVEWQHAEFLTHLQQPGVGAVYLSGTFVARAPRRENGEDVVAIEGSLTLFRAEQAVVNGESRLTANRTEVGRLTTATRISVSRGVAIKARYVLHLRARGDRPGEKATDLEEELSLRAVRDLDERELQRKSAQAVEKAVRWLRERQSPGGSWGSFRAVECGRVLSPATALVVRALLRSGVSANDPAIVAARGSQRGGRLPSVRAIADHVASLLASADLTLEDQDRAREAIDELARFYDATSALWRAGDGIESVGSIPAARALEALAATGSASSPSLGTARALASSLREEGPPVRLDLERESGALPPLPTVEEIRPGAWVVSQPINASLPRRDPYPAQATRKLPLPGASALAVVSGLKGLLPALTLGNVDAESRKTLERSMLAGLGMLQDRWTVRFPGSEAGRVAERMEYLFVLSQLLNELRVKRIGGSDWRLDGVYAVLDAQRDNGGWGSEAGDDVAATAFGILFLLNSYDFIK